MRNWFALKTRVSWRWVPRRTVIDVDNRLLAVHLAQSRVRPAATLLPATSLTYSLLGEVLRLKRIRWIMDLRSNPHSPRLGVPRLTADSDTGIVRYLAERGVRYRGFPEAARCLQSWIDQPENRLQMPEEDFVHVQDFQRVVLTRKSPVGLIVPNGAFDALSCWLGRQFELEWNSDQAEALTVASDHQNPTIASMDQSTSDDNQRKNADPSPE